MIQGTGQPEMVSVSGVVTRADGTTEDLGVIAFAHKNPVKVLAWRLGRVLRWLRTQRQG